MIIKRPELSECELTTMKCIWDAEGPITCQEIMEQLVDVYGLHYKDTTVYTFLKNLKDKGFVESYRKGLTYYQPARSEEDYRNDLLKRSEKFWFDGSVSKMVAALVQMKEVSPEERKELKRMIDDLDN
jgi:predicted transcriptional regulator